MTSSNTSGSSIAIDLTAMNHEYVGGVSRYSLSLTRALLFENHENITIFCTDKNYNFLREKLPVATNLISLQLRENILIRLLEITAFRIYPSTTVLRIAQNLRYGDFIQHYARDYQLIYTPTTYSNFTSSVSKLMVSLHDTQEMKFPEFFDSKERKYRKAREKVTLKFATYIQVSSNFVRDELLVYFSANVSKKQIVVIPEGVDRSYFRGVAKQSFKNHLSLLYPASFLAHKNHEYLFKALELLPEEFSISVKLTGEKNTYIELLMARSTDLARSRITLTGRLSDSQLLEEYQKCDVVISCSKYESSSLPLLEGLSCGAAALASSIPAHLEMAKDLPITLFDLDNPESLTSALVQLLRERQQEFRKLTSVKNLAGRDWSEIALMFLDFFQDATLENFK
jgi:glycosyltransferase involved in cell wall biosynthesis